MKGTERMGRRSGSAICLSSRFVVSALWRGERGLQVLGVAANTAAMTLVFALLWLMHSVAGSGDDLGTFVAFMVVAAVLIDKTTADHTFSTKWSDLMRLRIIGARPRWLIGGMMLHSLPSALIGAAAACIPGALVSVLFGIALARDDASRNAGGFVQALWQTMLISVLCILASAFLSGRRVTRAPLSLASVPQRRDGLRRLVGHGGNSGLYSKMLSIVRSLFTFALLVVGIGWGLASSVSDTDAASTGLGMMPLLVCWAMVRLCKPMLRRWAGRAAFKLRGGPCAVVSMRDVESTRSMSLFTLTAVVVAVFIFMYCAQVGLDAAARSSLHAMFDDVDVVQADKAGPSGGKAVGRIARQTDGKALVLGSTQVEEYVDYYRNCNQQMREYSSRSTVPANDGTSSVILSGDLADFVPLDAVQGDISGAEGTEAGSGVIAVAGGHVGQQVCVARSGGQWSRGTVTAVLHTGGGAVGNYIVPAALGPAQSHVQAGFALVHTTHAGRACTGVGRSERGKVTWSSGRQWIDDLPLGSVDVRDGGANGNTLLFTIYPILLISLVGLVSVVANDAESRRKEARAAWMVGMRQGQWSLVGMLRVGAEVGFAGLLAAVVVTASANLTSQARWAELWRASRLFIPWLQLGLMAVILLLVVACGGLLYRSTYRRAAR